MSDGIALHLEQFKKAARRLRKAYSNGDTEAVARVSGHVPENRPLRHADFLHVIAREAGHESWPKLKFTVESAAMSREERAERLKMALYFGQHWVTEKLLKDDPELKNANLGLQIALYDLSAVRSAIAEDPAVAARIIGVRSPLLHLAFSKEIHRSPEKSDAMLAIAELLVANGADVNDGYPAEPGADHKLSALYGALCHADNFALGKWFLEQGADPNDDESLYHSTELNETRALALLLKHGANPDGTNALPRALDFENLEMVRLLLEAGANPNLTVPDHPSGMPMDSVPSLHQAARRGRSVAVIELLLKHGADPDAFWKGHTAYATARIYGNRSVADFLKVQGHMSPLSENEQVLSACADGVESPGQLDIKTLNDEDKSLLTRIASEPGRLGQLKALVEAGLDPDSTDYMGLPPLHLAGWNGLVPETAFFLSLKPDLTRKNDYGGDALDTVLHGSEFTPKRPDADHIECARLLLEAGSVLYPQFISGCGNEDMVHFLQEWRERNT
ncbi:MAG: ankyrin repeat domain-containing protein [Roseibium sp.]|uniref:ankyrin repeat domain-containing protein n=1 Tax=Roseibium sp. TaxID=1936156 RepID=UPI00262B0263|nr:ankyrin repeat domain-containing protein [Roseibium sp.]MCV0427785.1 ankyrin repeat domain-containing protein [Roseibium sp.]